MIQIYKDRLARDIEECFPEEWGAAEVSSLLEQPKNKDFAHIALPVFRLSKALKKAPVQIASEMAEKIQSLNLDYIKSVDAVSGFINLKWSDAFLMESLKEFISQDVSKLGHSTAHQGEKLIIDYGSPNVAKPMHVGHLRATVIGQAIKNLAKTQGYEVVGLNHLGDYGVQFGKLAWAYKKWAEDFDFENQPFESLYSLYVKFHEEAEKNSEYEKEGAKAFKELEDGDPELVELWQKFIKISLEKYQEVWDRLRVQYDLVRGESFYSDRLESVEEELREKELLVQSEGAWVVEMEGKTPPCLIRKKDGASLYATRDLASAIYKMEELKFDVNLYVTGQEQKLHFSQVFSVLDKMGYPWVKDCHHITFGMYRFKDKGKMSSRKGDVIKLNDILDNAVKMVKERIESKNPDLQNKDAVSEMVGVGAVIFNDLMNDRVKDVEFDWEKITDFEGDSGPYIQYSAVRCKSLLRKSGSENYKASCDLKEESEIRLMTALLNYESVLKLSYDNFKPNYLASYLLELSKLFSGFYSKCPILNLEDQSLKETRLFLVESLLKVLTHALGVLHIQTPEEM